MAKSSSTWLSLTSFAMLLVVYLVASITMLQPNLPMPHQMVRRSGFNESLLRAPNRIVRRSSVVNIAESPIWPLGPCQGGVALLEHMPNMVCAPLTCLRSSVFADVYVDMRSPAMEVINDENMAMECSNPTGGQLGLSLPLPVANPFVVEVSFIIPFKDKIEMTLQLLLELFRTAREATSIEFVLVDEASTEDVSDIEAFGANLQYLFRVPVTIIRNRKAMGFGQAINIGIHQAVGHYVVALNNDVLPTRGWLRALLATFQEFPDTGIAGPLFVLSTGNVAEAGGLIYADGTAANYGRDYFPDRQHLFSRPADYISAACIMARRQTWLEVKGFHPAYGVGYYEDTDLSLTMQQAGYAVRYQPYSVIIHDEGCTLSSQKQQLMARNKQLFASRWLHRLKEFHCPPTVAPNDAAVRAAGKHRMLWVDDIVPEPDHDSGSVRTLNILRIFRSLGFYISYQPMVTDGRLEKYVVQTRALGVNVLPGQRQGLWEISSNGNCLYDVIVIARFYIYERVHTMIRRLCPSIPIIYDTVDLSFIREAHQAFPRHKRWQFPTLEQLTSWIESNDSAALILRAKRDAEVHAVAASTYTFVVSNEEMQLLRRFVPTANIQVVSNVHIFDPAQARPANCAARKGMLFVGNFNHSPNRHALDVLLADILPAVKALLPAQNDMVLHIVGSNRVPAADWHRAQITTIFHGALSEEELLQMYNRVKVVVAPLMSGAGVKGKINQAMLHGVPVVATPVAAEGMHLHHGVDCMIAATAQNFAAQIMQVYNNCTLWKHLVLNGFDNVDTYFSMKAATSQLQAVVKNLHFLPRADYQCVTT